MLIVARKYARDISVIGNNSVQIVSEAKRVWFCHNKSGLDHLLLPVKLPEALGKQKQVLVYIHSETNCVKSMKSAGDGEERKMVFFLYIFHLEQSKFQGTISKASKNTFFDTLTS